MKPVIAALVGPTGVGKTHVAVRLCAALDAQIVSMDSMQVYRGMEIGTAKPSEQERKAAVHHLIDVVDPREPFTVADYRELAFAAIEDILRLGKLPLLVGGTGLYLNAVSYEMGLGEKGADAPTREALRAIADEDGGPARLHDMLMRVDPESAQKLHPNDVRRVIRALEIHALCGKGKSEQHDARREGPYHVLVYGLSMPRDQMYARIDARVDDMMARGLVREVEALLEAGVRPGRDGGAMQAIGYKEIAAALRGETTMERAVELIKRNTRRYAKRQWTWFRHDPRTQWFDWSAYQDEDALVGALLAQIRQDLQNARKMY